MKEGKITGELRQFQTAVLNYLKTGEKTMAQIVNKFHTWHYYNDSKHVGDIISMMVNSGKLSRVKKGIYSLNLDLQKQTTKDVEITNQQQLFFMENTFEKLIEDELRKYFRSEQSLTTTIEKLKFKTKEYWEEHS